MSVHRFVRPAERGPAPVPKTVAWPVLGFVVVWFGAGVVLIYMAGVDLGWW